MDAYEGHAGYKKPVLSNPAGVSHLFFQYQAQIQSCYLLKMASLLFPLGWALRQTRKGQTVWLRNVVLVRYLENGATFDSVPPQMDEPN